MIGKLRGLIDQLAEDHAIIDVGGVGYVAHCSARTLQSLGSVGEPTTLSIETIVREDMIRLYGFSTDVEREWFRLLIGVQGVGAKVALALLGTLTPSELANAVALQDKAMVARAPGIGPKVAQRIVAELKGKTPTLGGVPGLEAVGAAVEAAPTTPVAEAVSALTNLGYSSEIAAQAIAAAVKNGGEGADTGKLVRMGLKELAR